jgi:hypothetical protein
MKTRYKIKGVDLLGFLSENPEPNVKLQFLVKGLTGVIGGYSVMSSHPDYLITVGVIGFILDTFCSCLIIEEVK